MPQAFFSLLRLDHPFGAKLIMNICGLVFLLSFYQIQPVASPGNPSDVHHQQEIASNVEGRTSGQRAFSAQTLVTD
jgi:hypothetical protein